MPGGEEDMDIFVLLRLVLGLAFFLFGMNVMSSNLEKMAGGKLEQLLKKHTSLQQLRNFLTEDVRPDREERWLNLFLKKINS